VAAKASSQVLQRVSALSKRLPLFFCLAPVASASRRFGPAAAAKASSQALQRVSALGERLPLFLPYGNGRLPLKKKKFSFPLNGQHINNAIKERRII
jgi:hypothetical protein